MSADFSHKHQRSINFLCGWQVCTSQEVVIKEQATEFMSETAPLETELRWALKKMSNSFFPGYVQHGKQKNVSNN